MGYEELLEVFQYTEFMFWKYDINENRYSVLTSPNAFSYFQIPPEGDLALLTQILGEDRLTAIIKVVEDSLMEGDNSFKTTFNLEMDQQVRTYAIFGRPDKMEGDQVVAISGIVVDITFAHKSDRKYDEREALETIISEKNHFLSELSHELRTPLNGISGMAQLLKLTELNEEQQEYLRIMQAASRKMGRLIDNLIRYTLFLGKKELAMTKEKIRLRELFRQTIESQKIELLDHHLSIEIEISSELETEIKINSESLREALDQLLDNAIKFSSEGQIFMRAYVELGAFDTEILTVEIEDEGVGFDVRDIKQENYSSDDLKKMSEGLGLGLQIVSHVCEQSGMTYHISSTLGAGTKVALGVPFEKANPLIKQNDFIGKQMMGKRALIVDDDENGRVLLSLLCKKSGLIVQSVSNGFDAIKLANENRYDLIYLDIQMPLMNGVEVFGNIRESGLNKDVPVIAVTAYALKGDEERFLSNGFDGYIGKPVEFNRFEQVTRHVLQLKY